MRNISLRVISALFFFSIPLFAHAQVYITEIMYAPKDTDKDHEWVEICNDSIESIDVSDWIFYEADTNHGMQLIAGDGILEKGMCAIIADNATVFANDYTNYGVALFDSVFSLKTDGELIEIRNANKETINAVTYEKTDAADETGKTLTRNSKGTFDAAPPTPGTHVFPNETATTTTTQTITETITTVETIQKYQFETLSVEPPQDIFLRVPTTVRAVTNARTLFYAEVYNARGIAVDDPKISWAFGDGGAFSGRDVAHAYAREGTYTAHVVATYGTLTDEADVTVVVTDAAVSVRAPKTGEWVGITNESDAPLDLSLWRLRSPYGYFIFPDGTTIAPHTEVRFDKTVTKLNIVGTPEEVTLLYPSTKIAARGSEADDTTALPSHTTTATNPPPVSPNAAIIDTNETNQATTANTAMTPRSPTPTLIGTPLPHTAHIAEQPTTTQPPPPVVASSTQAAAAVLATQPTTKGNASHFLLALVALIALGVIGVALGKTQTP